MSASAHADWPRDFGDRPLVLPKGLIEVAGDTLGLELSSGRAFEPVWLGPTVRWGFRPKLNFVVTHERGICFGDGCGAILNDTAIGAQYELLRKGGFDIRAQGLLVLPGFDPFGSGLSAEMLFRLQLLKDNALALRFTPRIYLGMIERSGYPDFAELLFGARYRFTKPFETRMEFGWQGRLDNFSQTVLIPVRFGLAYSFHWRFDAGFYVEFGNLFGRGATFNNRRLVLQFAARF